MEIFIIALIMFIILEINKKLNASKFVHDNQKYFAVLKEDNYDFYIYSKYGEKSEPNKLFNLRIRNGLLGMTILLIVFITNLSFINIVLSILAGFLIFKLQYMNLRKFYKRHLHDIDLMLPYYLKSIEILIQHYTVPVAIAKSVETAPDIFKPGLKELIDKINSGDMTVDPYMEFARQYPVRDSMRMMRLLYRLGLGSQDNKQDQLLIFSKNISALQNKAREQKYKDRLSSMERRTMIMLVITGGGSMILILLSMLMLFS